MLTSGLLVDAPSANRARRNLGRMVGRVETLVSASCNERLVWKRWAQCEGRRVSLFRETILLKHRYYRESFRAFRSLLPSLPPASYRPQSEVHMNLVVWKMLTACPSLNNCKQWIEECLQHLTFSHWIILYREILNHQVLPQWACSHLTKVLCADAASFLDKRWWRFCKAIWKTLLTQPRS
jgi:hypothetical protein